jgi:predicted PurR-regulated permease PerM
VTYLSLDTLRGTLIVIAVALLLAIGLDPAVNALVRRGFRRGWAVALVFLGLVAVLGGAIYAIVPPIVTELAAFVQSVPTLITDLQHNDTINRLNEKFGLLNAIKNSNFIQNIGSGAAGSILTAGVTVASVAADLVVVLILSLFFLAGFPKIKSAAYRLAPATKRVRVTDLGDKIVKQMGGYLFGATLVAIQAGLLAGLFAAIVGLPYPWAIGLGAAVLDFVPVIGPITIGICMTVLGFTQSLTVGIVAAVFYVIQHLFEAYWLYPRVMRRQVDISTGAVVVALLVGGALLGVTGAVLAVPVAAAVQLIVREVVMPIQERN